MKYIIVAILVMALLCTALMPTAFAAPDNATKPSVKILSIGHSYAWNSVEYLRSIANSQGVDLTVGVVYRGNCPLSAHLEYFNKNTRYGTDTNTGFYLKYSSTQINGHTYDGQYSLGSAVKDEKWDYIMFQECLDYAGSYEVIEKSLKTLKLGVEKHASNKNVQYMWHGIWALEKTEYMPSDKVEFKPYNWDQQTMYEAIKEANSQVLASDVGITGLVPTGEAFQLARQSGKYDPTKGGISLNADNISHANTYGKYLAGLVWYMSFTGCAIDKENLTYPSEITKEQAFELVDFATEAVTGSGKTLGSVDEVFDDTNKDNSNDTSSEIVYTPGAIIDDGAKKFNPLYLIPVGAAVAIAGGAVAVILNKKKKK